jgi:hypothetical protein
MLRRADSVRDQDDSFGHYIVGIVLNGISGG